MIGFMNTLLFAAAVFVVLRDVEQSPTTPTRYVTQEEASAAHADRERAFWSSARWCAASLAIGYAFFG